jgi:RNA polymerase sigma factor (sigma-70 family)
MAQTSPNPFLDHIRHLIGSDPAEGITDSQLLERFLISRDESAVEGLVRRYGPLVFGVCRRVLRNAHAAEDAFQATFLILVRKAPTLGRCERLGSFLYTVAYRLALRARANEARRQRREAQAARDRADSVGHATTEDDCVVALEEELHKLPEKYRSPLVLCYLEGKTNEQAAAVLGCAPGSMSARLDQARERLREGLARRGYAVPAAGLAVLLSTTATQAAVPVPLLANTVRAAVWIAGERTVSAGFVSAGAVALARGACRAMLVHRLSIAGAVLVAVALLGTGATLLLKASPQSGKHLPDEARAGMAESPAERLPRGALARMGTTGLRHGDIVYFAAYTPDGKALLTAGKDGTVRLWDLATGKEIRRFDWGEALPADRAPMSLDGLAERRMQQFWDDTARSCQAALSADGKVVAASRRGQVCLWQTDDGKELRRLQTGEKRLVQLAFSADGKSLLTLGPGRAVTVWEVATGKGVQRNPGRPTFEGFAVPAQINDKTVLVSPGLKYLASNRRDKLGTPWILIRDLATGKELRRISAGAGTMAIAFSADGKTLAWEHGSETGTVLSDVVTGKELCRLKSDGRNEPAMALAFSADGKVLAVCRDSHAIELWDVRSGKLTAVASKAADAQLEEQSVNWLSSMVRPALAFSPDGKTLVSSLGGPAIRQFRTDTGAEIPGPGSAHRAPVSTLALSADGKSLWTYSSGDPARSWDWRAGKQTAQREVPGSATYAVFAADGRFGYVSDHHFSLCGPQGASSKKTWKVADGESPLVSLALSRDGSLLATRNFLRPQVHLWDTTTGKKRFTLGPARDDQAIAAANPAEVTGVLMQEVVFSPDGRFLASSGPNWQLCLWDTATGTLVWEVLPRTGQAIERFAFSPSGNFLACVYADRTVMLYETATGAERGRLGEPDPKNRRVYLASSNSGPADEVQLRRDPPVCLAISSGGRYLATAQHTREIHLWDVIAGREVGRLKGHEGGVVSLLFAPDGKQLLSGGSDTTVLTWDVSALTRAGRGAAVPAISARTLDVLWTDLADKDAVRAFTAMRKLCVSVDQAVALIKERVHPVAAVDPKRLVKLLADLESEQFESRQQAEAELLEIGERAEPALRKALAGDPPLDLRQRLERLLKRWEIGPTAELRRDLRAVEVLELIGSPDAHRLLESLAGGAPSARLSREASKASKRLAKRVLKP